MQDQPAWLPDVSIRLVPRMPLLLEPEHCRREKGFGFHDGFEKVYVFRIGVSHNSTDELSRTKKIILKLQHLFEDPFITTRSHSSSAAVMSEEQGKTWF
jgi:hypothetical protein